MSRWRKGLLLAALVWVHMAVIFGIGSSLQGATLQPEADDPVLQVQRASLVAETQAPGPAPAIAALMAPQAGRRPVGDAFTTPPPSSQDGDSNQTAEPQPLKAEDFFSPDEVDVTANPVGNFEETLRQGLPLYVHGLVIEFWIDSTGNTVQVRCVEGDCSDATTAGLAQLLASLFQPAVKDGLAVPSRKLIQIDASPLL